MMSRTRSHVRVTAIGFAVGALTSFVALFGLFLIDLTNPHFEAMYEAPRPHDLLGMLRFQRGYEVVYLLTGLAGAVVGYAIGRARRKESSSARAT